MLTAVNSTITGNVGTSGINIFGDAYLTNTIVWGNDGPSELVTSFVFEAAPSDLGNVSGSGVLTDLGGNINAAPMFVASPDDVHLLPGSPAIDARTCIGAPAEGIDGDPRPTGVSCDIGADEAP